MSRHSMRFAALAAVLLAGSCATPPTDSGAPITADPDVNHAIAVRPEPRSLNLAFSPGDPGLMPEEALKLDNFVHDYFAGGQGSISISVPEGPDSQRTIDFFGERLAEMGVPRSRILVGSHPAAANGEGGVEISFISYAAHPEPCGDWPQDAADSFSNLPMPNFGCAVQHNIAAMVANPRDLEEPRGMGKADATRRAVVMDHYEKGEVTQADKHTSDKPTEQSAPGSGLSE